LENPNKEANNWAILGLVVGSLKNYDAWVEAKRKAALEPWADWESAARGLEKLKAKGITEAIQMTVDWFAKRRMGMPPITFAKIRNVVYGCGAKFKVGVGRQEENRRLLIEWWDREDAKEKVRHEAWRARRQQEDDAIMALLRFFCG